MLLGNPYDASRAVKKLLLGFLHDLDVLLEHTNANKTTRFPPPPAMVDRACRALVTINRRVGTEEERVRQKLQNIKQDLYVSALRNPFGAADEDDGEDEDAPFNSNNNPVNERSLAARRQKAFQLALEEDHTLLLHRTEYLFLGEMQLVERFVIPLLLSRIGQEERRTQNQKGPSSSSRRGGARSSSISSYTLADLPTLLLKLLATMTVPILPDTPNQAKLHDVLHSIRTQCAVDEWCSFLVEAMAPIAEHRKLNLEHQQALTVEDGELLEVILALYCHLLNGSPADVEPMIGALTRNHGTELLLVLLYQNYEVSVMLNQQQQQEQEEADEKVRQELRDDQQRRQALEDDDEEGVIVLDGPEPKEPSISLAEMTELLEDPAALPKNRNVEGESHLTGEETMTAEQQDDASLPLPEEATGTVSQHIGDDSDAIGIHPQPSVGAILARQAPGETQLVVLDDDEAEDDTSSLPSSITSSFPVHALTDVHSAAVEPPVILLADNDEREESQVNVLPPQSHSLPKNDGDDEDDAIEVGNAIVVLEDEDDDEGVDAHTNNNDRGAPNKGIEEEADEEEAEEASAVSSSDEEDVLQDGDTTTDEEAEDEEAEDEEAEEEEEIVFLEDETKGKESRSRQHGSRSRRHDDDTTDSRYYFQETAATLTRWNSLILDAVGRVFRAATATELSTLSMVHLQQQAMLELARARGEELQMAPSALMMQSLRRKLASEFAARKQNTEMWRSVARGRYSGGIASSALLVKRNNMLGVPQSTFEDGLAPSRVRVVATGASDFLSSTNSHLTYGSKDVQLRAVKEIDQKKRGRFNRRMLQRPKGVSLLPLPTQLLLAQQFGSFIGHGFEYLSTMIWPSVQQSLSTLHDNIESNMNTTGEKRLGGRRTGEANHALSDGPMLSVLEDVSMPLILNYFELSGNLLSFTRESLKQILDRRQERAKEQQQQAAASANMTQDGTVFPLAPQTTAYDTLSPASDLLTSHANPADLQRQLADDALQQAFEMQWKAVSHILTLDHLQASFTLLSDFLSNRELSTEYDMYPIVAYVAELLLLLVYLMDGAIVQDPAVTMAAHALGSSILYDEEHVTLLFVIIGNLNTKKEIVNPQRKIETSLMLLHAMLSLMDKCSFQGRLALPKKKVNRGKRGNEDGDLHDDAAEEEELGRLRSSRYEDDPLNADHSDEGEEDEEAASVSSLGDEDGAQAPAPLENGAEGDVEEDDPYRGTDEVPMSPEPHHRAGRGTSQPPSERSSRASSVSATPSQTVMAAPTTATHPSLDDAETVTLLFGSAQLPSSTEGSTAPASLIIHGEEPRTDSNAEDAYLVEELLALPGPMEAETGDGDAAETRSDVSRARSVESAALSEESFVLSSASTAGRMSLTSEREVSIQDYYLRLASVRYIPVVYLALRSWRTNSADVNLALVSILEQLLSRSTCANILFNFPFLFLCHEVLNAVSSGESAKETHYPLYQVCDRIVYQFFNPFVSPTDAGAQHAEGDGTTGGEAAVPELGGAMSPLGEEVALRCTRALFWMNSVQYRTLDERGRAASSASDAQTAMMESFAYPHALAEEEMRNLNEEGEEDDDDERGGAVESRSRGELAGGRRESYKAKGLRILNSRRAKQREAEDTAAAVMNNNADEEQGPQTERTRRGRRQMVLSMNDVTALANEVDRKEKKAKQESRRQTKSSSKKRARQESEEDEDPQQGEEPLMEPEWERAARRAEKKLRKEEKRQRKEERRKRRREEEETDDPRNAELDSYGPDGVPAGEAEASRGAANVLSSASSTPGRVRHVRFDDEGDDDGSAHYHHEDDTAHELHQEEDAVSIVADSGTTMTDHSMMSEVGSTAEALP